MGPPWDIPQSIETESVTVRDINLPATLRGSLAGCCPTPYRSYMAIFDLKRINDDRRQIIRERIEVADKLAGQYVEGYDFTDRPLEVRWKGHSLPYCVFSKDQRVSHAAIVENLNPGSHLMALLKFFIH